MKDGIEKMKLKEYEANKVVLIKRCMAGELTINEMVKKIERSLLSVPRRELEEAGEAAWESAILRADARRESNNKDSKKDEDKPSWDECVLSSDGWQ